MKTIRKLIAVILALLMVTGTFAVGGAGLALTASAAETGKAIRLVQDGKADYITGAQTSNVWFGNYMQSSADSKEPVKWRVLSNADGKLFLLADQNLDVFEYNKVSAYVTWETCDMRSWLNGYGPGENQGGNDYIRDNFKDDAFTAAELATVADSELTNADNPENETPGGINTTDKVFLLSYAEANNTAYGFTDDHQKTDTRIATITAYVAGGGKLDAPRHHPGAAHAWWLRSPGFRSDLANYVSENGFISISGDLIYFGFAVRPALNVNLNKVLFTSAAENGKVGDGLTAVESYTGSDWKLTLLDDSRADFTASCTAIEDGKHTITYSGAQTGENEMISAMIVNSDGAATYYGVLENAKAGLNTLTLDVSGKLGDGDKLYIFNEQTNGDYMTDYASALIDVTEKSILKYDLWVGETEVTENCTSGEGWEYEPATNTLTLNNYRYEGEGHSLPDDIIVYSADTSRAAIVYSGSEPLNLVLEGDNAVKQTGGDLQTSVGLFSEGALTVSGTGTLTAEAGEATLDVESQTTYTSGIYIREKLTVTGGTVTGRGGTGTLSHTTWGIYAKGFDISGGEVYAYGGTVTDIGRSRGLQSDGPVTVSGGKLTCRGGKSPNKNTGLWTGSNMTVTGGSVDVSSGEGSKSSYGIEGARRGDVLYIGASVNSFVSVGIGYSVDDFLTVKNEIPGKGWKTVDGTGNVTEIAANPAPGAGLYMYKKVEFKQFKKYDLWVGETEVTSVNLSGEGWSFEPETNTLTLDGFTYSGVGHKINEATLKNLYYGSINAAIAYLGSATFNLVIEGENFVSLTGSDLECAIGICSFSGVDISGVGSLDVTICDAQSYCHGVYVDGPLTISDSTLKFVCGHAGKMSRAVDTYGDLTIKSGEVYAKGGEADDYISYGIFASGTLEISGGKVTALGGKSSWFSAGILLDEDSLISGGTVYAAGGDADISCGCMSNNDHFILTVNDGVESFSSSGNSSAFEDLITVKNLVAGTGWDDPDATDDGTIIPVNTEGAELSFKKVEFPYPTYSVSISGENMTKTEDSGDASQTVDVGSAMTAVVYTANVGYYFPTDYAVDSVNGVRVTRDSFTQITVSGTPTADAAITLPAATVKPAPDMTVTAKSTTCDKEVVVTATLPADATGTVSFTLKGDNNTYIFSADVAGGKAEIKETLNADDYTITAKYAGDGKYAEYTATTTVGVEKAPSTITASTDKQTYVAGDNVVVTITIPADAEQPTGAGGNVTLKLDGQELTAIKVENGTGTYTIPSVGKGNHTVTAIFNGDSHYASSETTATFSVGCKHEWKEPTWDWTQDVHNPTYTAECSNCDDIATGTVESKAGDRVEATVDKNAYTPYTAEVTLGEQTFTDKFNVEEPGTMLAARKAAFDAYKETQKKTAEGKRLPNDSAECKALIDDAIAAIDGVTYNESKTLQQNKDAVDAAANFTQLDADLAAHRAIHYAAFVADGKPVASVPYTIDTKSITEPAVPAKSGYTAAWEHYTLKAGGVTVNAVYTAITYTATFVADGKTVGTAKYTVESTSIDEPKVPKKIGYAGAWTPYTFDVGGITVTAVYTLIGNPSVHIADYQASRTVWYHKTLTYKANAVDVADGAEIHWFVNGEDVGTGDAYTVALATDDYTIQAKIVSSADGVVFAESEIASVHVCNNIIVRLIVFLWELILSLLFHLSLPALPVIVRIYSLFAV